LGRRIIPEAFWGGYVSRTGGIHLLFVEDDENYRENLVAELSERGFGVHSFADATSLLRSLDGAVAADVIMLEWKLPKTSGIDLLAQLRGRGVNLPVVFLTGHTLPANESLALERGAIDFIDKARGLEVLVRRLKSAVKASKRTDQLRSDRSMICGQLLLRPDVSRAYWDGVDLDLTVGEYNIVHLLASNVGRYVTYRAIYDRIHHEGFIAGRGPKGYRANVRSAIKRIRNKFRERDPAFVEIENYICFGYRWGKSVVGQEEG
jgi:two-component system, OmpR family, response regulator ChvI